MPNPNPSLWNRNNVCIFRRNIYVRFSGELSGPGSGACRVLERASEHLCRRCAHAPHWLLFHRRCLRFHRWESEFMGRGFLLLGDFMCRLTGTSDVCFGAAAASERAQRRVCNGPLWHFINDLVGTVGLNGVDVIAVQGCTECGRGAPNRDRHRKPQEITNRYCRSWRDLRCLKRPWLFLAKVRLLQLKCSQRPGFGAVDRSNKFCSSSKQTPS